MNNAGILATGPSWTHDAATRRLVEVNTLGAINGTPMLHDRYASSTRCPGWRSRSPR